MIIFYYGGFGFNVFDEDEGWVCKTGIDLLSLFVNVD